MRISPIGIAIYSVLVTYARAQTYFGFRNLKTIPRPFSNTTSKRNFSIHNGLNKYIRLEDIKRRVCKALGCKDPNRTVIIQPLSRKNNSRVVQQDPEVQPRPILSAPSDFSNDTSCMKFQLPRTYFEHGRRLTGADLFVHIKKKGKKRGKSKRKRRITLKVSLLNQCGKHRKVITVLRFRPAETAWYRLSLPVTHFRKLQKSDTKTLQLCLECKRCNKRTQVTLPIKLRKVRKNAVTRRVRRRKPRKLRKNRPFLLCDTKDKKLKRSKRQLQDCNNATNSQTCCRSREYISFNEIGLGNDIVHPAGFYKTSCQGSCSLPLLSNNRTRNNMTCSATQTDPFRILVVMKREVGVITINNGLVKQCSCLNSNR